jgi:hypothetical protein
MIRTVRARKGVTSGMEDRLLVFVDLLGGFNMRMAVFSGLAERMRFDGFVKCFPV